MEDAKNLNIVIDEDIEEDKENDNNNSNDKKPKILKNLYKILLIITMINQLRIKK